MSEYIVSVKCRHIQEYLLQSDRLQWIRAASAALEAQEAQLAGLASSFGGQMLYVAEGACKVHFTGGNAKGAAESFLVAAQQL